VHVKAVSKIAAQISGCSRGSRKDLENHIYAEWLAADAEEKIKWEEQLRRLLAGHAQAVMYSVLRRNDDALVTEAINQVMLNLPGFRGEGLFTTWAHRIILQTMYYQRRVNRRRRETSMDVPGFDLAGDSSAAQIDVLLTIQRLLKDETDYDIFEHVACNGESHDEAAKALGMAKATLSRKWERIKRVLGDAFTKHVPARR
jgi:DNA-directed RNA polymerase specialized sigma24 family protein